MAETSALQLLERARERLAKPGAWAQKWYAFTGKGNRTSPTSRSAVCWCMLGAIGYHEHSEDDSLAQDMAIGWLMQAIREAGHDCQRPKNVPDWNDAPGRTIAEVLAVYDRAISLARAKLGGAS